MDWNYEVFGNTLTHWATSLGLAVVGTFLLRIVFSVLIKRIEAIAKRTRTDLDDLAVHLLEKTRWLFIAVIAIYLAARPLELSESVHTVLDAVLHAGIMLQAGFWGIGLINHYITHHRRTQAQDDPGLATAIGALAFVARTALWAILVLTFMRSSLGIDITAMVASLGIGGIAVALALQNVLSDLLASLSIVLDKPFVIGDFVVVGDLRGTVEHVGLKTTRVRSLTGEQLVFANSDLLGSRIRNYKRMDERRVIFTVGVTYGTPREKLQAIADMVREAVEAQPNARFDRCHFKEFGASSLDFETVYFMRVPDYHAYMDTQHAINLAIYGRFEDEGLDFAFPTQTIFLENAGN
jgi:small-conductance mechanosensitive channel